MRTIPHLSLTGLLLAHALVLPVWAQSAPPMAAAQQTQARNVFQQAAPATELAKLRGGTQITKNDVLLAGTTANNTAFRVTTGSNAISDGAFSNMTGIPVVVQNSGANVLIQNAVIVNLHME